MRNLYAIILAGGEGKRFGSPVPKQFLSLAGEPLFLHSLKTFSSWPFLKSLSLVCHRDWISELEKYASPYLNSNDRIVEGGNTRHASTLLGLQSIPWDEEDLIFIHDAARPFFSHQDLDLLVQSAVKWGASTIVSACHETVVQRGDREGFIEKTLDRNQLLFVKTPQIISGKTLKKAQTMDVPLPVEPTDLCSWMEAYGEKTGIVITTETNLKITEPTDLLVAEALLNARGKS
ncbi:2-C-methyl-D-erythritol 4-phosphate cytidylyltransferase [Leptospira ryugenii]|uniref:2-C-methyl-D-erythritol 4-phosphate cytidylyltransferase n=1 Tax=Leptospira ryugenii TaxID=1917863 RepID=A0A2P2DXY5_9LEPT|nr:IspD/TarI family cytidylyltransferase [Leptospira ryugenii]GBF49487.1 2-C-methyl-D-erythritol 4-phosphate cytidylyltransferase [Leptospira ryugenii]